MGAAKFNNRLQVTQLGLGNSAADTSLWKVDYEFGELNSNGTVVANKNTGNIAKQTVSFNGLSQPFVQSYKYDALYRLTEAKETADSTQNWKQEFGYDRYGNRTSYNKFLGTAAVTLTAKEKPTIQASNNRFNSGQDYNYDKAGNILSNFEGWQLTFNGDNKQTEVKDSAGNVIGTYFYNGDGMRIKKVTNSETVVFVYSGGKKIAEYSTDLAANASTKYLTEDHLGTPRVISDQSGAVLSRRDMMPFGEDIKDGIGARNNALKYGIDDKVREGFTGYEKDKETRLDFAEARMYENRHARFTAVDPLLASGLSMNPQSFNRYTYVMNDPLGLTDPNGLCPTEGKPCPDFHSGDVYFKVDENGNRRFNDVKENDTWEIYTNEETTSVFDSATNRTFKVAKWGWYLVPETNTRSGGSPLTNPYRDILIGGAKGVANFGIDTTNLAFAAAIFDNGRNTSGAVNFLLNNSFEGHSYDNWTQAIPGYLVEGGLGTIGPAKGAGSFVRGSVRVSQVVTKATMSSRVLNATARQLQKKFKHAPDFGITTPWNKAAAAKFKSAINQHINSHGTRRIVGKYRGDDAIHYLDPSTGLNVISNPNGQFLSGWKLGAEQLKNVLRHGGL